MHNAPDGASLAASVIADEIAKLVALPDSGGFSEDEFTTLKGRLIAGCGA